MKLKSSFILFCALIPFTLAYRMFQLNQVIDPINSLAYPEYKTIQTLFAVFILGALVSFLLLNRLNNDLPTALPKKSNVLFIVSLVTAFAFAVDLLISILNIEGSFLSLINFHDEYGELNTQLNAIFLFLYFALTVLSIVTFVTNAIAFKSGKKIGTMMNAPICGFLMLHIFVYYIAQSTSALTTENALTILAISFTLFFFLIHARLVSATDYKKSLKWVVGTGLFASFIMLITVIPRYIAIFSGQDELLRINTQPNFLFLILAIYMVTTVYTLCCADSVVHNRLQLRTEFVEQPLESGSEPKPENDKLKRIDDALNDLYPVGSVNISEFALKDSAHKDDTKTYNTVTAEAHEEQVKVYNKATDTEQILNKSSVNSALGQAFINQDDQIDEFKLEDDM